MTLLTQLRNNIDDHIQIGYDPAKSNGDENVYQLSARNISELKVYTIDGETKTEVPSNQYELIDMSGQVKGEFDEGDLLFEYKHSGFTDDELNFYLEEEGSLTKATLRCINILLSSASKRYDYKAGIKDIKASQVFNHLKELKDTYEQKLLDEDNSQVGRFATREHPAYKVNIRHHGPEDVSRKD